MLRYEPVYSILNRSSSYGASQKRLLYRRSRADFSRPTGPAKKVVRLGLVNGVYFYKYYARQSSSILSSPLGMGILRLILPLKQTLFHVRKCLTMRVRRVCALKKQTSKFEAEETGITFELLDIVIKPSSSFRPTN